MYRSVLIASTMLAIAAWTGAVQAGPRDREGARERRPEAKPCPPDDRVAAQVTSVRDARTVVLDDGTVVRLSSILTPDASDVPGAEGSWAPEADAVRVVRELITGANVDVALVGPRDRYGRRSGHVLIASGQHAGTDDDAPIWLQERMVEAGLARFDPVRERTQCASRLAAAERRARAEKRGLWALAAYRIRDAKNLGELMRLQSTFQLVRGRVRSAKEVRGRVFLNFGDDWRRDFTAAISKAQMAFFARGPLRPLELEGREIIVRGWIESYGGPYIEIRHTHQLELADAEGGPLADGRPAAGSPRHATPTDGSVAPPQERKRERPDQDGPGVLDL